MTQRIVMYSGGILSWAAAMRTVERHGRDEVRLLFTDTNMEDEDLYRFLEDSGRQIGVPILHACDPQKRTPWDVYRDKRMLGNARVDPCSAELKRKVGQRWLAENAPGATLVFGIDWTEIHRLDGLKCRYAEIGFSVEAPMCDPPWITKDGAIRWCRQEGVEPPRLYAMGFAHNNCGGFCCRAGRAHFAHLLRAMPERYAYHEAKEEEMRVFLGKDVSILRDRADGTTDPITLREFREQIEAAGDRQGSLFGEFEIGGCGCFLEPEMETA